MGTLRDFCIYRRGRYALGFDEAMGQFREGTFEIRYSTHHFQHYDSLDAGARAGACTGLDNLTMQLDNNLTGLTGSQGSSQPDSLDNP